MILIIQLLSKSDYKKVKIDNKGITLDKEFFIPWNEIKGELVIVEGLGRNLTNYFQFHTQYLNVKLDLQQFNITPKQLEEALKTYRIRFNK